MNNSLLFCQAHQLAGSVDSTDENILYYLPSKLCVEYCEILTIRPAVSMLFLRFVRSNRKMLWILNDPDTRTQKKERIRIQLQALLKEVYHEHN